MSLNLKQDALVAKLKERRSDVVALEAEAQEAVALSSKIESLKVDLERAEERRDRLAAIETEYLEHQVSTYVEKYGLTIR